MKNAITLLLVIVTCALSKAQNSYRKFLSVPTGYSNKAIDVKLTGDGSFLVLETRLLETNNECNVLLTKLNSNGDSIWSKSLNGWQLSQEAAALAVNPSNGSSFVGFQDRNGPRSDTRVGHINKDGVLSFDSTHTFDLNEVEEISSLAVTPDGGFVMTVNASPENGFYKGWIVRVKFDFSIEWKKEDTTTTYSRVIQLRSGDYVCIGGEKMVKYSSTGTKQWEKLWLNANLLGLCELADSNLLAVGQGGVLQAVKVSGSGAEIWKKNYFGTGSPVLYPSIYDIAQTPEGKLIYAGSNNAGTAIEYFLAMADSSGTLEWSKTFHGATANLANRFTSAEVNDDGSYILLAKYDMDANGFEDRTAFYKTDKAGLVKKLYVETDPVKAGKPIVFDDGKGGRGSLTFTTPGEVKTCRINIFVDSITPDGSSNFHYIKRFMDFDVAGAKDYWANLKFSFYQDELNGLQPASLNFVRYEKGSDTWNSFPPKSITPGIGTSYSAMLNQITEFSQRWSMGLNLVDAISDPTDQNLVSCFPNPGNGELYLKFGKPVSGSILAEIYDLNGQNIYEQRKGELQSDNLLKLETGILAGGCYTVRVSTEDAVYQLRYLAF